MPGLFATPKEDAAMFKQLFSSSDFQPDMLKIYPCMVMKGTGLYKLWKQGKFSPYTTEQAAQVIADATKFIPCYVRVMRVQRDIPSNLVAAGVKHSNLRQMVDELLANRNEKCMCIRCREIKNKKVTPSAVSLSRIDYAASAGREIFLSFEDKSQDALIGFIRLRIPSKSTHRSEITSDSAIIRELHVYGIEIPIGKEGKHAAQHSGFGEKLLREAERIARKEFGKKKLVIISGIGAREYYRKFGYSNDGPYMGKNIAARR
jgi:elongator complex protein 3